ncbi:hypothetical protein VQL36_18660 [Chengkuizengella sp. SCS-71B]
MNTKANQDSKAQQEHERESQLQQQKETAQSGDLKNIDKKLDGPNQPAT